MLKCQKACGVGGKGHPSGDPAAFLGGRQDQDRAGMPARRRQHRRAVPQGRHRPEPVLRVVKGVHGGGQGHLAGETGRAATSDDVKDLCREASDLKVGALRNALPPFEGPCFLKWQIVLAE